jgi:uncharacterized protein YndB with AHSA1/START domain
MFAKQIAISIPAAPEAVFAYVSDLTRHGEWANEPIEIRLESGDGRTPGSTFSSTAGVLGGVKATIRLVALDPPRRLVYDCDDMFGSYRWTLSVEPEGAGTRLTQRMERLSAPAWVRLVQPWLMWPVLGRRGVSRGLANIRARLTAPEIAGPGCLATER